MKTYKIGNKVNVIIRAYSAGPFANINASYKNQPYTIVRGVKATLTFKSQDLTTRIEDKQLLTFNHNQLSQVDISDVELNDKILNLIYKTNTDYPLCTKAENYISENNIIYLNITKPIYQVFIYNEDGQLEGAYGECSSNSIQVERASSPYLVVYSYEGSNSFYLDKPENFYCTVDLEIEGNKDDETANMYIHIEKCGLKINNNLYFNQNSNAADLSFIVLDSDMNYITIE